VPAGPRTAGWHTWGIASAALDPDDGANPAADQQQLPFDPPIVLSHDGRKRSVGGWLHDRLITVSHALVHDPGAVLLHTIAFVMRWALRLALPVIGAAIMLHLFPYHATAGGVRFRVEGTLFSRPGLSADTTFGNWEFKHVDGLPIGAHISPENVDVVTLAAAATHNGQFYVDGLRADLADKVPSIIAWLGGTALFGVLVGLAVAAGLNLTVRYLRRYPRRHGEIVHRIRQLGAALCVVALVGGYGWLTYKPHWVKDSKVTGTLAALQLFPGQLSQYYTHQSKVFDVISAIAGIQSQLQQNIEQTDGLSTAYNIMFISDMHLASTYPLVQQYASNFNVSLIINTGDESEFGTRPEMTSTYLGQLRAVTRKTPMIWLAGNHDSPATIKAMRSVPGVTVLGGKVVQPDGTVTVGAQELTALGLRIAALPDPRIYGGEGDIGSNDAKVVHALERDAVDKAVLGIGRDEQFDIFATHESIAADQLLHDLPDQIRQVNSGHDHAQNGDLKVQHDGIVDLVEGSTGAGGLDNINRGVPAPPIEFSIESVAPDCQFTKVVRFQIEGAPPATTVTTPVSGRQVTASTLYLDQEKPVEGRTCSIAEPTTPIQDVGVANGG
jgi:predicted MPP superfamily phosphohydrolase